MKERYDPIDVPLGAGSFGYVELVKRRSDYKTFACKTISSKSQLPADAAATRHEYDVVQHLSHPNIIRYHDADWTPSRAKLYMEYCEYGSLDSLINRYKIKGQMVPEYYIWSIVYQLASALCYCHEGRRVTNLQDQMMVPPERDWKVILHRDIKPRNVLVTSESMTALDAIKLGDFGLGAILNGVKDPTTYDGTEIYRPPEIRKGRHFIWQPSCDIFSLGCTIFQLYHQEPPFDYHAGSSIEHRSVRKGCPDDLKQCILQCLELDAHKRPSAYQILTSARQRLEDKPEHFAAVNQHRLLLSSQFADLKTVAQLLEDKELVNCRDGTDEETPLHRAARATIAGQVTARLLLDNGADVGIRSKNGETPLHVAAEAGRLGIVKLLLGFKASASARDKRNWLPIHSAASQGHVAVVKVLIDMGADKDAFTSDGLKRTPLHIAAANGQSPTASSLIESKADVNAVRSDGGTVIHSAAEGGCVSIVHELLAAEAKLDTRTRDGRTALLVAAEEGHAEIVRLLLCADRDRSRIQVGWTLPSFKTKSQYGLSPVHAAALGNYAAVLEIVLDDGFDVDAPVERKAVPKLGIEIPIGWTALHIASRLGHHEAIAVLLEFKAKKEQRTRNIETALHLAAGCGHIGAADRLIHAGADVEARAFKQFTPLHYAATQEQGDMVGFLLKIGANVDAKISGGATALHLAAHAGYAKMITLLMSTGAHIDSTNDAGQIALHVAAHAGRPDVVHGLMRSRIDHRDKRDGRGKRPIDIAMEKENYDVVEALGGRR